MPQSLNDSPALGKKPQAWGNRRCTFSHNCMAMPTCFMLFAQCVRRAASRAACTAGNNSAIKIPMIAITTNNSTSVKARRPAILMAMLL